MNNAITVETSNLLRFIAAVRGVLNGDYDEAMVVLWGIGGEGKTESLAYTTNLDLGAEPVFLRAAAWWNMTSLLQALCKALGATKHRHHHPMAENITEKLSEERRIIFVDEADYLAKKPALLDALRDFYDQTRTPIVLAGMEKLAIKIYNHGRFSRRVAKWVEYAGLLKEDVRKVADELCDTSIDNDLITDLWTRSQGNIARVVAGLGAVERFGKINKRDRVGLVEWEGRRYFADQPRFGRGRTVRS